MVRRMLPVFLAALAGLAFSQAALAVPSVSPGTTSPSLDAAGCTTNSGAIDDASGIDCPPTVCAADCVQGDNQAKVGFNLSYISIGRRFVESTVYTEFEVDAGSSGAGHELDGTISYDVEWNGFWTLLGILTGANDVQASVTLYLWDRDNGSKLIRQTELHHENVQSAGSLPEVPGDIGAHVDQGSASNSLTAKVIRGHRYRIGLRIRAEGVGLANASINVDYLGGPSGARWTDLKVGVSQDLEERLANLESRVDSLSARVDSLEGRVERVEFQLEHHTHQYLTGRGEGHNNTVATTSEAILSDDGEPSEDELRTLPPIKSRARPLPIQSVIETGADPARAGVATIRYTLPDPLHVTIRVYDAMGRVISEVEDSNQAAGVHEARFDPRALPAGVYFYRLTAGPYVENRRLTLLR